MIREFQPIVHRDEYTDAVAGPIADYFTEAIFGPLLALLADAGLRMDPAAQAIHHAAAGEINAALRSGKLWYAAGVFSGKLNASLSRALREIGATPDRDKYAHPIFRLPEDKLPPDLKAEAVFSAQRAEELHREVLDLIDQMVGNVAKAPLGIATAVEVAAVVKDLDRQFVATIPVELRERAPVAPADLAVQDDLILQIQIEEPIRDFTAEQLADLRERVRLNAADGARADRLVSIIETRYGIAKRRAEFIAEQETSLLISNYRETRYRSVGSERYRWSTSHDERVRKDHKLLNNTIQDWSVKPVTNRETGAHNHPGEDFRCLPGDSVIEFDGGVVKGFRRRFSGKLAFVVMESGKTIRATSNHPVLTIRGWKPIGCIDDSDHLVELSDEALLAAKSEGKQGVATLREIFETLREAGLGGTFMGKREQFHGDGTDSEVEVVRPAGLLGLERDVRFLQRLRNLALTKPDLFALFQSGLFKHLRPLLFGHKLRPEMAGVGQSLALREGQSAHANPVRLGPGTDRDIGLHQSTADHDPFNTCAIRNGELTLTGQVGFDDWFWVKLKAVMGVTARAVVATGTEEFSGHVFNLETRTGYYTTQNVIVSNCRCVAIPRILIPSDS